MKTDFDMHPADLYQQFAEFGRAVARNAALHDRERSFDRAAWDMISRAGLWRIPVPLEEGGLGGSWADCAAAMEGVASTAGDLGFLITMLGHVGSLRVLLEEGTLQQKARWLPQIMEGQVGITAMTEASGGSDLARMSVSARDVDGRLSLCGEKVHITNAPIASSGLVAGRMPALGEKKDITLFFLDLDAPGITIGEREDNLGIRTSPTANLLFEETPIEDDNIIGPPGDGLRILYRIIAFERALYGIMTAGLIEDMIERTMSRVEARMAFGRPLADYQYVQGRITDMKMAAVICRTMTYASMAKLENGAQDMSIACSVTKFQAGEKLLEAAEHMVQLHGHLGYMNNDISRYLRDAVGMRIAGGTSDIQRINIFNQIRARRRDLTTQEPGSAELPGDAKPAGRFSEHPAQSTEAPKPGIVYA
ncbi:acyl-CoA dehydrogenase family protein [Saliniramus sp.]|uniref:acyl-CoA dehydrogenase family protein n=1 Tax=Saliniramus sp. TaxID=2986772 RepID=UPI002C31637E|nr:acyl-CoA dehydrogenase family protein [Saliniramus sp.]HMB09657.1 acyl-CoA dehydrogenase family protein [Saliniramus sp.]